MFDWVSKLFGGGNQKSSSPKGGSTLDSMRATSKSMEEERKRREREEAARIAKQKAEEAKRAKERQAAEQPKKTVAPLNVTTATPAKIKLPVTTATPAKIKLPFSDKQLAEAKKNPNAPYSPELKKAAAGFKDPVDIAKKLQVAAASRVADEARKKAEWDNSAVGKTVNFMRYFGGTLAAEAGTVAPDIASRVVETADRVATGNKDADRYKKYADFRKGVQNVGNKVSGLPLNISQEIDERAQRVSSGDGSALDVGLGLLDAAEAIPVGGLAVKGLRYGAKGTKMGIDKVSGTDLARNSVGFLRDARSQSLESLGDLLRGDRAFTEQAARETAAREAAREAESAAQRAREAMGNLPGPDQIRRQAADAARIDDGVSSPSRAQQVQQSITQTVENTKAAIQTEFERTLMGLNDFMDSLTPRPLATQPIGAGGPDFPAQRAEFEAPEQPIQEAIPDDIPAPSKTPIVQAIESPNTAASKEAADNTPVAPQNAAPVKTRTIDDMTDEEVLERFGKTREEIQASRDALKAEKAAKEELKAQKAARLAERRAASKAAQRQAAIDAGEVPAKPSKDIFADKKRSDAPSKQPEAAAKTVTKEDNISYAYAYNSSRRQNRFTVVGSGGDSFSITANVPKNIKTIGGLIRHLYSKGHSNEANKIVKSLREMEARDMARNAPNKKVVQPTKEAPSKDIFAGKKRTNRSEDGDVAKELDEQEAYEADEMRRGLLEAMDSGQTEVVPTKTAPTKKAPKKTVASTRSADLEEHADIEPQTNMPREDANDIFAGKKKADATTAKADDGWTTTKNDKGENVDVKEYDHFTGGKITKEVTHFKTGGTMDKYIATKDDGTTRTYNRLGDATNFLKKPSKTKPAPTPKTTASTSDIFAGKKKADAAPAKKATGINEKGSQTNTERKFVAGTKGIKEEAAPPTKTPPKKTDTEADDYDTSYIMERSKTGEKTRSESKTSKGVQTKRSQDVNSRTIITDEARAYERQKDVEGFLKHLSKKQDKDLTPADEQVAQAYLNSGRIKPKSTVEGRLEEVIFKVRNQAGTEMGTTYRFDRKTASAHEIKRNFSKRLSDRDVEVSEEGQKRVETAAAEYTSKRDAFSKSLEKAIKTKSKEDIKALRKARDDMFGANKKQKIIEYDEARKEMRAMEKRGEKLSPEQFAELAKLKRDINVFQYDAVDSSLLSATGTMINNALNGFFGLAESAFVGKAAGAISNLLHGTTVGGNSFKGSRMGFVEGARSIGSEIKLRNEINRTGNAGVLKKAWGAYKNAVTTGNELSETTIRARIMGKTYDHYLQMNKKNGLKGQELKRQTEIDSINDPEEVRQFYEGEAYGTQGMSDIKRVEGEDSGGLEQYIRGKITERLLKNGFDRSIRSRDFADYAGKLISRFTVGFPGVVWRSGVQAGARRTPGLGVLLDARDYIKAPTPEAKAVAFQQGLEHAASAGTYTAIGMYLGATGVISGAYPSDPNEQKRWQAEGRTEWSIKIANPFEKDENGNPKEDYYDLRKSLGAFALPVMMAAQAGQNMMNGEHWTNGIIPSVEEIKAGEFTSNIAVAMWDVTPAEGPLRRINELVEAFQGKRGGASLAATGTRMTIPAAGFINEMAKIYSAAAHGEELEARDPDNQLQEFVNRIAITIPGVGERMGLDAKQTLGVDHAQTSILGRIFGAQKGHTPEGTEVVNRLQAESDARAENTVQVTNGTFEKILETMNEDEKGLYKRLIEEGKTLKPEKQKKIDGAIAGLADTDKDFESKFSYEGDWETQAYILQKKKDVLAADKSTKPTRLEELDREIKRTDVLSGLKGSPKENAKLYLRYKEVSQTQLKKMLDEEDTDNYNPELAYRLVEMDEMFTEKGLSWKTDVIDGWTKKKYDLDKILKSFASRGGGGRGGSNMATNVSSLKVMESEGLGGLKYKTVSAMPNLMAATPRKNFKKTISIKRGVQL